MGSGMSTASTVSRGRRQPQDPVHKAVLAVVETMAGRKVTTGTKVLMHDGHVEPERGIRELATGHDIVTAWTPLRTATVGMAVRRDFDVVMGMRFSEAMAFRVEVGGALVWKGTADVGDFQWMLCDRTPLPLVALSYCELRIEVDDPSAVDLLVAWAADDLRRDMAVNAWVAPWVTAGEDVDGSPAGRRLAIRNGLCGLTNKDADLYGLWHEHDCIKFLPDARRMAERVDE